MKASGVIGILLGAMLVCSAPGAGLTAGKRSTRPPATPVRPYRASVIVQLRENRFALSLAVLPNVKTSSAQVFREGTVTIAASLTVVPLGDGKVKVAYMIAGRNRWINEVHESSSGRSVNYAVDEANATGQTILRLGVPAPLVEAADLADRTSQHAIVVTIMQGR